LSDLAFAYAEGRADVDPLAKACDYCRRQSLCRVFERQGPRDDDDVEELDP